MIVAAMIGSFGSCDLASVAEAGTTYKPTVFSTDFSVYDHQDIPSEPLGQFALTLTGVVIGSAIQIETLAGATLANRVATGTTETFSVPAFGLGNALNNLRIKVRKGSAAPFYQPYETQATAIVGAQSIFVSQIPD
jgi:hypothetical protein